MIYWEVRYEARTDRRAISKKFEEACYLYNKIECWNARELQEILGYAKWDNFKNTIEKAKSACENAGIPVPDHFADVGKMIEIDKGVQREVDDMALMPDRAKDRVEPLSSPVGW